MVDGRKNYDKCMPQDKMSYVVMPLTASPSLFWWPKRTAAAIVHNEDRHQSNLSGDETEHRMPCDREVMTVQHQA
jgi:hypothetical protein